MYRICCACDLVILALGTGFEIAHVTVAAGVETHAFRARRVRVSSVSNSPTQAHNWKWGSVASIANASEAPSLAVAVMTALPGPVIGTFPSLSTVATDSSLLL